MDNITSVKGIHVMRTMGSCHKRIIPDNDKGSDFLKLYMLAKERTRLLKQKSMALLRLDTLQNRLKDIQSEMNYLNKEHCNDTGQVQNPGPEENKQTTSDEKKSDFKTMSIDY